MLAFVREGSSIPDEFKEKEADKVELLESFRGVVTNSWLCQRWTNPESLVYKVKDALSGTIRSPDYEERPGWYRGTPPDPLSMPKASSPRTWTLRDALKVELLTDDTNAVLLRERETSVKLWVRLTNVSPYDVQPEKLALKWHVTLGDEVHRGDKDVIEPFSQLGPGKDETVEVDLSLPVLEGPPPALARLATVGAVVASSDAFDGREKAQIGSFVYGRVADSRRPSMSQSMNPDAYEYMTGLARAYEQAGHPNHKVWTFDKGRSTPTHSELMNLHKFIRLRGTRGGAYVLTDLGHDWVAEYLSSQR